MHSVSGRHYDDRLQYASGVIRKTSEAFYNFRSLPTSYGNCRKASYPCYAKESRSIARTTTPPPSPQNKKLRVQGNGMKTRIGCSAEHVSPARALSEN